MSGKYVFVHALSLNPRGIWWVTTRRDGEPYSGMPLDHFLKYEASNYEAERSMNSDDGKSE